LILIDFILNENNSNKRKEMEPIVTVKMSHSDYKEICKAVEQRAGRLIRSRESARKRQGTTKVLGARNEPVRMFVMGMEMGEQPESLEQSSQYVFQPQSPPPQQYIQIPHHQVRVETPDDA
jgi:hypothetical protein